MKIQCRPVKLGGLSFVLGCQDCKEAWRLYLKSKKLMKRFKEKGGNDKHRALARRADWLLVKAAQVIYEDRENHLEESRDVPLFICNGRAQRVRQFACWNCNKGLYASWSRYMECIFCKYCFATMYTSWLEGKMDNKEVAKYYEDHHGEPYMSNGIWEDYYWDKKAKDMKKRKKNDHP